MTASTGERELVTIELYKEAMKFSAGHFTIFSADRRERMHGHNFAVQVSITGEPDDNGMMGDYGQFKRIVSGLCAGLDEWFLLPGRSPHLKLRDDGECVYAEFAGRTLPFLRSEVQVLPIRNITVEELARYLCARLVDDGQVLAVAPIHALTVKVSSGPGQLGAASWRRGA
ncbi:6-pyruvoyltetrahydropterin/6-carboxytetrahydropterin synthase [Nannocystis exedens]|uniref:6-carboxy-5,6,7,8-tetrahydropterin synthase n=1 Tax=Nannocystis exedens TaxID=54 RepID=A0A1I2EPH1_9BACT|nr:6-carboxytetrahydropterin synthase [Nannocystis exedens]PCC73876.1 6-pyruvoyltetrahydropterin synthase [Nannocystis exedens]SFE94932.1 6-pyruvoyltetrahydropterin/6-carboxytetrahydropterin synthase [Nannocystis exedens]